MMLRPHGLHALALTTLLALTAHAQQPAGPPPGATVLNTGTQLVVLDVVVLGRDGKPVHDLKREDFILTERSHLQTVRNFEEHAPAAISPPAPTPPLVPGNFTDYTPKPPSGPLNVLLFDCLNTSIQYQTFVRYQLEQYVKSAASGSPVAIFGLNTHLLMLQGFNSDPSALKYAVEHKSKSEQPSDPALIETTANLREFEAEFSAAGFEYRLPRTIDAFNVLVHYLAAFSGRKTLIWLAGSYPLSMSANPQKSHSITLLPQGQDREFRETINLLTRSQVAIYPIDARGLVSYTSLHAIPGGNSGAAGHIQPNGQPTSGIAGGGSFITDQEHAIMENVARASGGLSFYSNNDLVATVAKAIQAGSVYYTLTYTPTQNQWNGEYHRIEVALAPHLDAAGYQLSYRRGYFADDPAKSAGMEAATQDYSRSAMVRGAPAPQEIPFKVRVLPVTLDTEDTLAPNNLANPDHLIKPPFRRLLIDYAAVARAFTLTADPDGHHSGKIEFTVRLYDPKGGLLNSTANTVTLHLSSEDYSRFMKGVGARLQISVPSQGEAFLRIGIHDIPSNRFGVVELPISAITHLLPLAAAPENSATNSTPP